jgi:ubiquinone/menaquinone biosynthesis C-methylase UbiE
MSRRRQARGLAYYAYALENDPHEMERLDQQHYMLQCVIGRRYHAPLKEEPRRVLDVGTGTGAWLLEMASEYPECDCFGLDISPMQPTKVHPPNCQFRVADLNDGIPLPGDSCDLVRHQLLMPIISGEGWSTYIAECFRVCAPGGWIEMIEDDYEFINAGPWLRRWSNCEEHCVPAVSIPKSQVRLVI